MIWVILPDMIAKGGDTTQIMNYMLLVFLLQYIPKVVRFMFIGWRLQHVTGYIFGSAAWGFVLNLAVYFCSGRLQGLYGTSSQSNESKAASISNAET